LLKVCGKILDFLAFLLDLLVIAHKIISENRSFDLILQAFHEVRWHCIP